MLTLLTPFPLPTATAQIISPHAAPPHSGGRICWKTGTSIMPNFAPGIPRREIARAQIADFSWP
jgi:hypothetical protein